MIILIKKLESHASPQYSVLIGWFLYISWWMWGSWYHRVMPWLFVTYLFIWHSLICPFSQSCLVYLIFWVLDSENTLLFEMIVGVLTTCHTQYTWDRRICIFYLIEQHSSFCYIPYRCSIYEPFVILQTSTCISSVLCMTSC